jgi:ribonuclease HI
MSAATPVTIYTDGSCLGNPGPGGWAAVLLCNGKRRELSGGLRQTTNNRMELLAVIEALTALTRSCAARLHTDSRYLADALNKGWLAKWRRTGWQTADKKPVKNQDLWQRLIPLLAEHQVEFCWVRAHNGDPENERCDTLAKAAAGSPGNPVDAGYAAAQAR